ncbi:ABC transporter substrate-binding protein [Psychromarinibacter sp. C21-152]|uniref:Thiamine pyrimidine synthase n=1 Tax=Psychromarinibacter sediminicola TaxID=3033385 RepID=A0AAE3T9S0_9RHOB|nr:ABC transporter substrate-binding protein [Psychromarinibacter sediminicola]MDF0602108.1 ABC transporter substrate-binding protein [Psychromarinibacter sediminicola]
MLNPRLNRRALLRNIGAASAATMLPGLGRAQGNAPEVTSVEIISVRDPQHSGQLALALEYGFFEDEGLDVSPNYTVNGPDLPSLAASGRVKVLFAAMEQVASLRLRDLDFRWVMKLSDISNTQGVVVGNNSGIEAPADLEGKRIGMYAGASVELAIENMCEEYGVDFSSLEFVNMEPPEQAIALMQGDIDVMACWEPYVTNAARSGGRLYFTGSKSYIETPEDPTDVNWLYLATGLTTSGDFLAEAPNTLKAMMRAMMRANEIIINDPAAAVDPIAKGLGIPTDGLEGILRANDYRPDLDQRLATGYPDYIHWAVERGFLNEFVPLDEIVDTSLLAEVAPDSVKI